MAQVKFTKGELRLQQVKLSQLMKYLPTLQLKKAMLQLEVNQCLAEMEEAVKIFSEAKEEVKDFALLLSERVSCDVMTLSKVSHVDKEYENIAGVEIPIFKDISFSDSEYFLFDTPAWTDAALEKVKDLLTAKEKLNVIKEKKSALERELRDVSIRVNLFEKVLIPRTKENIKKIKVFLGDQQLAEIAQAKVAKSKLEAKKAGVS